MYYTILYSISSIINNTIALLQYLLHVHVITYMHLQNHDMILSM